MGGGLRRGPTPFRFENMWLKVDGFKGLLREWWQGIEVRGRASFSGILGRSGEREVSVLAETEQKKEAKDAFTNGCCWKKSIGGRRPRGEGGDCECLPEFILRRPGWRADIEGLHLNQLNPREAEDLEKPFTEEEIHGALMEMRGDKAPGRMDSQWLFGKNAGVCEGGGGGFLRNSLSMGLFQMSQHYLSGPYPKERRLKKVLDRVVRQIKCFCERETDLDASLVANEVIDYWHKRKEKGLICKLDIEKAYDSLNWEFLMKVLRKMGFGSRWMDWMWWCISTAKFSILINGVPTGFFPNSKGLRQGDPLSPYLFILGMEVLSTLFRRAGEGGFLSGCRLRGRGGVEMNVSHLLFADDTIIFCKAEREQVDELEELAAELGCRLGALPTVYLGLPLGVHHKTSSSWDGVEERMRRRLAQWKRQYISKGGRITLIKSTLASIPIYFLSLIRIPKYAYEKENLWKRVIGVKYGQEGCGWRTKDVCGPYGVGLWKEIMKEADWCWESIVFKVGKGTRILNAKVSECGTLAWGQGGWNLRLARDFNDWELEQIGNMLNLLKDFRTSTEEDAVRWKRESNGVSGLRVLTKCCLGPQPAFSRTDAFGWISHLRVGEIAPKRWRLDINFSQDAVLMLSSMNLPDGIQAEVRGFQHDGSLHLQARSQKYGKGSSSHNLSYLVKRRKQHLHYLEEFGVDLILGCNGFIWVGEHVEAKGTLIEDQTDKAEQLNTKSSSSTFMSLEEQERTYTSLETRQNICRIANAVRVLANLGFSVTVEVIKETVNLSSSLNLDIHEMLGSEFYVLVAEGEATRKSMFTKKKG
ncbi:Exosome complex component RRP4-like [Vitis vinifera]|uniref:Exosome complex component RRP4-like n=1 Tax=Vitis vinifera TaxID=29760 RepID=A0A438F457_VITVI|nr:Exosome complex component RRP4-like [Vitis vinifera]